LTTLMLAGIRDLLVITTPQDAPRFQQLLGDGTQWGISLHYAEQVRPEGIAQALLIAEPFLKGAPCALILGDNLFHGHDLAPMLQDACKQQQGATVFAYHVSDPERYGVIRFNRQGRAIGIEEKPAQPVSHYAVTGLYLYDSGASAIARTLVPSARGELEISDVNRRYLEQDALTVRILQRGYAWLDTGTHASLLDASSFIATLEQRQGLKIACPEEVAWRQDWIDAAQLEALAAPLCTSSYGRYLMRLLQEGGGA
uniref:glucose-1-phosphate thymidylyltransferase RfbA n=1 Tax=Brachymonas denitrificans TaxID=28220 RepID=UPI0032206151